MKTQLLSALAAVAMIFVACGPPPATGPKLNPAVSCTTPATAVTADALYTDVLKTNCATSTCHGAGATVPFKASSGAEFKAAWVGKASTQTMTVPLVTSGDADKSYVMYKITGQAATAGGGGAQMPLGEAPLSADNICKIFNWIEAGAL